MGKITVPFYLCVLPKIVLLKILPGINYYPQIEPGTESSSPGISENLAGDCVAPSVKWHSGSHL